MTGRDELLGYMEALRAQGSSGPRTLVWSLRDQYDASGRKLCVWCGRLLPPGKKRQRWCSNACVSQFLTIKGDMGHVRSQLAKRDKHVCRQCGQDCAALLHILKQDLQRFAKGLTVTQLVQMWLMWDEWLPKAGREEVRNLVLRSILEGRPQLTIRDHLQALSRRSLWEADHIRAVAEGGHGTDLSNYRTLCRRCHLLETNALKARMAAGRKS